MSKPKPRKPGEIVEKFDVEEKGGKLHVAFRYPKMSDINGILKSMNAVIVETEFLRLNKRLTKREEYEWLRDCLKGVRKMKKVIIVAEVDGVIGGSGNVDADIGACSHVGNLGISLREKYANMGIGTKMMEVLMGEAKNIGIEVLKLSYFDGNTGAKHVYEKLGFKEIGVLPKARKMRNGRYCGAHRMYKILV